MVKTYRKFNSKDADINAVQGNVEDAINTLLKNPVTDNIILTGVSLGAGDNKVAHKLNREIQGALIIFNPGAAVINVTAKDSMYVTLGSSGPATISLLVF